VVFVDLERHTLAERSADLVATSSILAPIAPVAVSESAPSPGKRLSTVPRVLKTGYNLSRDVERSGGTAASIRPRSSSVPAGGPDRIQGKPPRST